MKLISRRRLQLAILTITLTSLFVPLIRAQESEARVIDEVVAQVDNEVITLSMVKREMKDAIAGLVQSGKSESEATTEIASKQGQLIASLINEQLLLQQGKQLGLSGDVEAEVNRRMLDVAKGQGIKTIEELKKAMKESGFDYDAVRFTMRAELTKQAVLNRDVDARIFYNLSTDELQAYYKSHMNQFKKPESVTLSEIFLSLAGKNEAEVKAKANQLIAEARGGADFGALAVANSERQQNGKSIAAETKGVVGTFQLPDLRDNIAAAIKNIKVGEVTEPIRYDEGFQILRLDARIAGSDAPVFNENQAREMITQERVEPARKEYMEKLRKTAYIKISEQYRDDVMQYLNPGTKPAAAASTPSPSPAASTGKKSETNGNKP